MAEQQQHEVSIQLENSTKTFSPGEKIIGQVVLSNELSIDVTSISILFEGNGYVHGKQCYDNQGVKSNIDDFGSENYFQRKIILLESDSKTTLQKGKSTFPFEFTIPYNIPSSYLTKGYTETGQVYYFMIATVKTHQKERFYHKPDLTSIVKFKVNGILDLNKEIGVDQRVELQKEKYVCTFNCTSGPVGYSIKLPRKGFVPGEFVDFTIEISNMCRKKVKSMKIKLVQKATYNSRFWTLKNEKVICDVVGPSVEPGETEVWSGNVFQIPQVPPTRLGSTVCSIMDIQYVLKFKMTISGLTFGLKSEIPITIGTIALGNYVDPMLSEDVNLDFCDSSNNAHTRPHKNIPLILRCLNAISR